ncbi:hypothetical protein HY491_02260 [Candidatus Woesearchaeota archaeon]|nr:hypothetical protein [Candidatus Woesearchaeota archaeon]
MAFFRAQEHVSYDPIRIFGTLWDEGLTNVVLLSVGIFALTWIPGMLLWILDWILEYPPIAQRLPVHIPADADMRLVMCWMIGACLYSLAALQSILLEPALTCWKRINRIIRTRLLSRAC